MTKPRFTIEFGPGWICPDPERHPDRRYFVPEPFEGDPEPLGDGWQEVGYITDEL